MEGYFAELNANGQASNGVPVIQGSVTISGTLRVGSTLTAKYTYDPNNLPESGSTFRWYLAENSAGVNAVLISSAGSSLLLLPNFEPKYIRVEVTPRDQNGNIGANYSSEWYGPIQAAEQVNQAPLASNVTIRGNPVYCGVLTGMYDYNDAELDAESGSTYRWLRASATNATPEAITGATSKTYTVSTSDQGKYIYFEVTPKAASGSTTGAPARSNATTQIQGALPTVTFTGNATICEGTNTAISLVFTGTPPFNLEYTNGKETFNLSTSNYTYQLAVNTGGTYKGTRLTDIINCPVTNLPSSAVITAKALPSLDFSVGSTCFTGDSTLFRNTSASKSSIKAWSWNFGDNAGQNTSTVESPKHKYPAAGSYNISLAGENTDGCRDTISKTVVLGEKPVADLLWDKECYAAGMITNFKNSSVSTGKISKYNWSISEANNIIKESATADLSFNVPAQANYTVKLKIETDAGCIDSVSKMFSAKPLIRLQDSMYNENFEGNSNWNIELSSQNNWYLGDPPDIAPHSGGKAYYASFPAAKQSRQLVVSSPCFDFTAIQKPFIDVWINYNTPESKEGAVIQYRQDSDAVWTTAGQLNAGMNWYNNNNISSAPGNQKTGWSGASNGWVQARQSLDALSNKTGVRFRLVYGSAADASTGSFAFDDVFIGQRSKKVLVEHFTNLSDAAANQSNIVLDSVLTASGANAIAIQYHTSFPGTDSLNQQNVSNPAARVLFYGIGKVPMSYVDGGLSPNYIYDFSSRKLNTNDITNRSFDDPRFNLTITAGIQNSTLQGNVKITALRNFNTPENSLFIAVVEDIKVTHSGKIMNLRNVLKYMYPSAAGTQLQASWSKGQEQLASFSWPLANVYNPANLKVVSFIQNNQSKEVFQVEELPFSAMTSTPSLIEKTGNINIYPNPSADWVNISFEKELQEDYTVQLISAVGKTINQSIVQKGSSIINFSVSNIPAGIYYLKIESDTGEFKTTKLIIRK